MVEKSKKTELILLSFQQKKYLIFECFFLSLNKLIKRKKSKTNKKKHMIYKSGWNRLLTCAKKNCGLEII
jgi:hypothetical protein